MQEALVVRRETHVSAPPAAVFALMTDPAKILRWMGTEAELDGAAGRDPGPDPWHGRRD